jgi:ATP-binding cassette, subfamily C (CFTR/MRP), member 1
VLTIDLNRNHEGDPLPSQANSDTKRPDGELISAESADIGWGGEQPIISDATFSIRQGSITVIQGATASGKSMLLKSLLGLGVIENGSLICRFTNAGYSSQEPWLMKGTVRQNIIGPSTVNTAWYKMVLDSCALDMDISRMGQGDETLIGGDGIRLSGGQQSRLVRFRYRTMFLLCCLIYLSLFI